METMVADFKSSNSCAASGLILHTPYEVPNCKHKIEHWLVQCREMMGIITCPADSCSWSPFDASSDFFVSFQRKDGRVLTQLEGQIADWLVRNPDQFPETEAQAMNHAIGCITDAKTKRIFAAVHELSCSHFMDGVTKNWAASSNDGKCLTCDAAVSAKPRPDIQAKIDAFINANQEILGCDASQNQSDVAKFPALWHRSAEASSAFQSNLVRFTQHAADGRAKVARLTNRSQLIRQRQANCQKVVLVALLVLFIIQFYPVLFDLFAPYQVEGDDGLLEDRYCSIGESWWRNPPE